MGKLINVLMNNVKLKYLDRKSSFKCVPINKADKNCLFHLQWSKVL